ncbi:MAG: hypothetical protein ACTMKV_11195, partial [Sphingomonas parapaucimobilis]
MKPHRADSFPLLTGQFSNRSTPSCHKPFMIRVGSCADTWDTGTMNRHWMAALLAATAMVAGAMPGMA